MFLGGLCRTSGYVSIVSFSFIDQLLHFSRSIAVIWCLVVVVNFDSTPSSETPQTKSYFLRASTVEIFGTRYNVSLESVSE